MMFCSHKQMTNSSVENSSPCSCFPCELISNKSSGAAQALEEANDYPKVLRDQISCKESISTLEFRPGQSCPHPIFLSREGNALNARDQAT